MEGKRYISCERADLNSMSEIERTGESWRLHRLASWINASYHDIRLISFYFTIYSRVPIRLLLVLNRNDKKKSSRHANTVKQLCIDQPEGGNLVSPTIYRCSGISLEFFVSLSFSLSPFSHLLIARWIVNSRNLTAQSKCREFYDLSAGYIHTLPCRVLSFSWISNSRGRESIAGRHSPSPMVTSASSF